MTDLPPGWGNLSDEADEVLGELAPELETHRIDPVQVTAEAGGAFQPRMIVAGARWMFTTPIGQRCTAGWVLLSVHLGIVVQSVWPGLYHPIPVLGLWQVNVALFGTALIVWEVAPSLRRLNPLEQGIKVERTVQFYARARGPVFVLAFVNGILLVPGPGGIVGSVAAFFADPHSWEAFVALGRVFLFVYLQLMVLRNAVVNTSALV